MNALEFEPTSAWFLKSRYFLSYNSTILSKSNAKFYDFSPWEIASIHFFLSNLTTHLWVIAKKKKKKPIQYLRHYSVDCARAGLSKTPSAHQEASPVDQLSQERQVRMPGSPVSQQNPQGGKDSRAGPGPGNVTQSGLRICPRDQCCKESTAEPRRRKTFTEAPGRGRTGREHWVAGPRGLRHHQVRSRGGWVVQGQVCGERMGPTHCWWEWKLW